MSAQIKDGGVVDVLADLQGVVRIAKAASLGVTGNKPRIERAEQAIAAVAELIEAAAARLKEGSGQMTEAEHRLSNAIALVIGNRLPGNAGWVLVPPEPTEVMLNAALKLQGDDAFLARAPAVLSAFVKIYKAMIANVGGAK